MYSPAFARAKKEKVVEVYSATEETQNVHFFVSEQATPGGCIEIKMESGRPLLGVTVAFYKRNGTKISSFRAFSNDRKDGLYRQKAYIPISSWLTEDIYTVRVSYVETEESNVEVEHIFFVEIFKRTFPTEIIPLSASNTAIRTDKSPARMAQIDLLNEIIFSVNEDALRMEGDWQEPLHSKRITSGFGDRRTYEYSNGKKSTTVHNGIDYGVPIGTPVFACADGRVVLAEKRISTGWTVAIEHFPGIYSLYYHLDSLSTSVQERVRAGTLIGKSGNTGLSTGPHLHWEVRVNGQAVDPHWFLSK